MTDLNTLLRDLKSAERGSNALDVQLDISVKPLGDWETEKRVGFGHSRVEYHYIDGTHDETWADNYSTSIDSAMYLLKSALPGARIYMSMEKGEPAYAMITWPTVNDITDAKAPTLPLAICTAIVEAKINEARD